MAIERGWVGNKQDKLYFGLSATLLLNERLQGFLPLVEMTCLNSLEITRQSCLVAIPQHHKLYKLQELHKLQELYHPHCSLTNYQTNQLTQPSTYPTDQVLT